MNCRPKRENREGSQMRQIRRLDKQGEMNCRPKSDLGIDISSPSDGAGSLPTCGDGLCLRQVEIWGCRVAGVASEAAPISALFCAYLMIHCNVSRVKCEILLNGAALHRLVFCHTPSLAEDAPPDGPADHSPARRRPRVGFRQHAQRCISGAASVAVGGACPLQNAAAALR